MATDMVCGAEIRKRANSNQVEYADETYYFCSSNCLNRFEGQPDLFTYGPGEGKIADRDRGQRTDHPGLNRGTEHMILEQPSSDAGPA